jgi:hypothetical protein
LIVKFHPAIALSGFIGCPTQTGTLEKSLSNDSWRYFFVNIRINMILSIIGLALCLSVSGNAVCQEKPNVVIMLVDNLGWGELGVYGGGILRGAETPRLDQPTAEDLDVMESLLKTNGCTVERFTDPGDAYRRLANFEDYAT